MFCYLDCITNSSTYVCRTVGRWICTTVWPTLPCMHLNVCQSCLQVCRYMWYVYLCVSLNGWLRERESMCKCFLLRMFECVRAQRHESSLPIMYIEFLFRSFYLSAPIWQTHINRWPIEEGGLNKVRGGLEGQWGQRVFMSKGLCTMYVSWNLLCTNLELFAYCCWL